MPHPNDGGQAVAGLYPDGVPLANAYQFDPGVCVLPVCEDPNETNPAWSPVEVGRLHAPFRTRTVRYEGEKESTPPVAPAPGTVGRFQFLGGSITFTNSWNTTFQNCDWGVTTEYSYVETCVSRNQDGFVLGTPPFYAAPTLENIAAAGYGSPTFGAVAAAGRPAKLGYMMGNMAAPNGTLPADGRWGYNEPSFYPGNFLNDGLVNSSVDGT